MDEVWLISAYSPNPAEWEAHLKTRKKCRNDLLFCKGHMVVSKIKFIVDLGSCVVIVKNVPAQVCQQCGEASFDNETAKQLEKMVSII